MEKLWSPNPDYERFDPQKHDFLTAVLYPDRFLPYIRHYCSLSADQLSSLIYDAQRYHWQALDLSMCGLDSIPDELWELTDLEMLWLGWSNILRDIHVGSSNTFLHLPRKIEQLQHLQFLSLWYKDVHIDSSEPLNLPNLHDLIIGAQLTENSIPRQLLIPSLKRIEFCIKTRQLDAALFSLKNLIELRIIARDLQDIPKEISNLTHLRYLSITRSEITQLPPSMRRMTALNELHFEGSPLHDRIPPELRNQSAQEIIRYVLAMQGDAPREHFNESKMIIVGQAQVGKSSLLERLIHDTYSDKPSTEGIRIEPWIFEYKGEEYRLNLWDFGGQEIYHATHQFFLTRRSLYILVWDALSEDEYGRIDYWLRTIQSFADDSPILIVVNKCDQDNGRRKKLYLEEYQDRYPQIRAIYEVSCRDNIGIEKLRSDIQSIAVSLPLMTTPWFTPWLNARKALEELAKTKNHIPFEEYQSICETHGVAAEDVLSLAKYLHDLGVILYYHEDMLLKDMVILSSEWGTDAVYKILDQQERQLKDRNGILYANRDLKIIWDNKKRYPQKYHQHLLNLMENFQLSFLVDKNTYLVAELLEEKPIELSLSFEHGHTLSFRYDYDFMPAGIMTRFIVYIHGCLETIRGVKQCWKKGAYLRLDTAYARVELNDAPPNRHVLIRVSGPDPRKRQELLTIIRRELDRVNSLFRKIVITKKIPCICQPDCPTFFEYEDLLRAERKGKQTVECQKSWENVDLRKLLDGVESIMEFDPEKYINLNIVNSPVFNPVNTVTAASTSTNENTNTNTVSVSVEIRNAINDVHESLNDLRTEADDPVFDTACNKVEKALTKLDGCQTEEEVKRSGVMKKLERFLKECHDPESDTGKLLAGVKYAKDIVLDLGRKYNKLAGLLGAPSIPLIGT